ncbi:MAG TPA: hypothetical protein VIZ17_06830 [Acetobacteraceae bacterium]
MSATTAFLGLNRAVPSASLLSRDDPATLGFDTTSWKHLNRYVAKVEGLPTTLQGGSEALTVALARLRSLAAAFGSPKQLRHLIQEQPDALAGDQPPATLYASVAWMVQHLHQSASSVIATLQTFPASTIFADDVRTGLQRLGADAQTARAAIGPLVAALRSFKTDIVEANAALSEAYRTDAAALQQLQEQTGSQQVKLASVQTQIEQLGFFSAGKKRELDREQEKQKEQQQETSVRSETLRAALAAVEPIQNEGFWLEPGIDDLVSFLDGLRKVLTTFGSGVTQLAADAADTQLSDAAGMQKLLGNDASIEQWKAIDGAASRFLARALIDFPPLPSATQEQP